jgi:transposase InsO family protein
MTPKSQRDAFVKALLRAADDTGDVPGVLVRTVAQQAHVNVRTVYRWIAEARTGTEHDRAGGEPFRYSREHLTAIAATPTLKHAYRDLRDAGLVDVSYETFRTARHRESKAVIEGVTNGAAAAMNSLPFNRVEAPHRNAVWQMDHSMIPVYVRPPWGSPYAIRPWLTVIEDDFSRVIPAVVVSPKTPNSDTVCAALAKAMVGFVAEDGTQVFGVPQALRFDQGADYISEQTTSYLLANSIRPDPTNARAPWEKGKIERFFKRINNDLFAMQPGFADAKDDSDGALVQIPATKDLLHFNELLEKILAFVPVYNEQVTHSGHGMTPVARWASDSRPLTRPDPDVLRLGFMPTPRLHTVSKGMVRLDWSDYVCRDAALQGRKLTVRYIPHDATFVSLFDGDEHICDAVNNKLITAAERGETVQERYRTLRLIDQILTEAARIQVARVREAEASGGDGGPLSAHILDPLDGGLEEALELAEGGAPAEHADSTADSPQEPAAEPVTDGVDAEPFDPAAVPAGDAEEGPPQRRTRKPTTPRKNRGGVRPPKAPRTAERTPARTVDGDDPYAELDELFDTLEEGAA